jgi:hypothetical protein
MPCGVSAAPGAYVSHETDERTLPCQPRGLFHSQDCGPRNRKAPQVSDMPSQSTHLPKVTALWAGKNCPWGMTGTRSIWTTPANPGQGLLTMPFDALRVQYGSVVMAGLAPRSLLASGTTERALDALEKLILGPLARQR